MNNMHSLIVIVTLIATVLTAGWVSAWLTQLLKRESWRSSVKQVLAIVIAALVGLATAWLSGDVTRFVALWNKGLTADQIITFAVLVYTASAVWYHKFFKDMAWAQNLGTLPKK